MKIKTSHERSTWSKMKVTLDTLREFQVFWTKFLVKINPKVTSIKKPFSFLGQVDFNKSSMTRMIFLINCRVVLLIGVFDWFSFTCGQMLLVKYNQKNYFFTNHLLKTWHHLMLTCGTIWMLPHGNILPCGNIMFCYMETFIWCHMSTHCYLIKW